MGMFIGESGKISREYGCGQYEEIEDATDRHYEEIGQQVHHYGFDDEKRGEK